MNLICDCGSLLFYAKQSVYDKYCVSRDQNMFYQNMGRIPCDRIPKCPPVFVHLRCSGCSKLYHKGNVVRVSTFDYKTKKEILKTYKL